MKQILIAAGTAALLLPGAPGIARAADDANSKGPGDGRSSHPQAAAIFDAIDKNGDGKISANELGSSKRFQDADRKEVGEAFKRKDLNGDGSISKKEFGRTFGKGDGERGPRGKGRGDDQKGKGKGKGKSKGDGQGKGKSGGKRK